MKKINVILLSFIVLSTFQIVLGQNNQKDPPPLPSTDSSSSLPIKVQKQLGTANDIQIHVPNLSDSKPSINRPNLSPKDLGNKESVKEYYEKLNRTKGMIIPSPAYYEKFKTFLKTKNTGLARIQPERNCSNPSLVVSVEELERCADVIPIRGGGSLYSFRFKTNDIYPDGFDIHFKDNKFEVTNKAIQGIISGIGTADIENIGLDSESLKFLIDYKLPEKVSDIEKQNKVLAKGFEFNGFTYSNSAEAAADRTYILRSIAYAYQKFGYELDWKKQRDIIIIFKVVGQENDGSLVILWKELKRNK